MLFEHVCGLEMKVKPFCRIIACLCEEVCGGKINEIYCGPISRYLCYVTLLHKQKQAVIKLMVYTTIYSQTW